MRHITIAHRLKPFSHTPGISCLIPHSFYALKAYPTKLIIFSTIHTKEVFTYNLPLVGPSKDWTVSLDLEKNKVRVSGHFQSGYSLIEIYAKEDTLHIRSKKGLSCIDDHITMKDTVFKQEDIAPTRLFLGANKKQEIEPMRLRSDIREFLPVLYRLSYLLPLKETVTCTHPLVDKLKSAIASHQTEEINQIFQEIYLGCFSSFFIPQYEDPNFLGIKESNYSPPHEEFPIDLLYAMKEIISSLFIQCSEDCIKLLPALPYKCVIGRLTGFIQNGMNISYLFKGKQVKIATIISAEEKVVHLQAQDSKAVRVNGKEQLLTEPIQLQKGYNFFDHFKK